MIRMLVAAIALVAMGLTAAPASAVEGNFARAPQWTIDNGTVVDSGGVPALRLRADRFPRRAAHTDALEPILTQWRTSELFICVDAKAAKRGKGFTRIVVDAPRFDHFVGLTFWGKRFHTKCGTIYNPVDPQGGAEVSIHVVGGQAALVRYALVVPAGFK